MILQGKTNKEIGEELFIGEVTVKTHIHNLLKKLSASNRVDAILLVKEKMQEK
ncbi:MAG: response regulator transcription factor, partial [Firmicutes bacterium]|nr:response regulator transcription factor [Bacillota bacterium]